jgi:hypothetical protein
MLRIWDFYPGSDHFLIPDPDPNIFSSRTLHEKWNANLLFPCCLCFKEQSLRLSHSQKDPGSGKNSSRIQGVKKHRIPDPHYGLKQVLTLQCTFTCFEFSLQFTTQAMSSDDYYRYCYSSTKFRIH